MEKLEFRVLNCPKCGVKVIPKVSVNNRNPLNTADKIMEQFGMFFPHTDVDYVCEKDGHLPHLTYRNGFLIGCSGGSVLIAEIIGAER
jgi:hypothetical protein